MIHTQRDQTDEAEVVIRPNDSWFRLAANATKKAITEQDEHEGDKAIYAHSEVKKALECLFHDKCAYCESKVTAVADWDVDHFRPKGRVAECKDHPGYYWLTYVWENLYPSCQHCNQWRKDRCRWADPTELPPGGKCDQFPLLDENTRAMGPSDDVHAEHTLLIDPCFDDPEEYLAYDPTGQIFALRDNPCGKKTIEVFALVRRRLKVRRREVMAAAIGMMRLIASAKEADLAVKLTALLEQMQADTAEYAGMVRYVAAHTAEFGI
jgi:uncharacterized protein (TIGR02646 family)